MKVTVREDHNLQLEEVYTPIVIKTRLGEEYYITQRDYGIEITKNGQTLYINEIAEGQCLCKNW